MAKEIEAPKPEGLWGNFKSRINNRFVTPFLNKVLRGGDNYKYWDNVTEFVKVQYPPRFAEVIHQAVEVEGYLPVLYHTHRSHPDIFSMVKVGREVMTAAPSIEGVGVPGAVSMETGHQGTELQDIFAKSDLDEWLHAQDVHVIRVTRRKDEQEYGIERTARKLLNLFISLPKENFALGEFPEAATTAGKRNDEGEIIGLQEFNDAQLLYLYTRAQLRAGKKLLYIPISSTGSEKIFDPDRKKTRWQAKAQYIANRLIRLINPDWQIRLINTVVGRPFSSDWVLNQVSDDGTLKDSAFMYKIMAGKLISANHEVLGSVGKLKRMTQGTEPVTFHGIITGVRELFKPSSSDPFFPTSNFNLDPGLIDEIVHAEELKS
jgi:hypothetical protein